ncbi:MAG: hypothetical protein O2968_11650 [Acidobacteria bacterium]|nr:hypothetical protein [Acidobacteriota bacterium]
MTRLLNAFLDPWRWEGTISRERYALVGLLGFTIKHNLDRFLATLVFERQWGVFNYWVSPFGPLSLREVLQQEGDLIAALVATSIPFIWIGVALTLRRLRTAGLPTWLVVGFFVPFLNLLFLLVLAVLPAADVPESGIRKGRPTGWMGRVVPEHPIGAAAMGAIGTNLLFVPLILLGTAVLNEYGWGLFVGLPFCLGLLSVVIFGYHAPRSLVGCLVVSTAAVLITAGLLLASAIEGLICVMMAAPLAVPLAWLGSVVGYVIQRHGRPHVMSPIFPAVLAALPLALIVESALLPEPPVYEVMSAIEIQAPPQDVWGNVVAFAELPEPEDWVFRVGIAHPIRAEIRGTGVGAERHCVFSTGPFVEPIEVWDEPNLLKFSVTSNPAPMQEWTPYDEIHPPHLKGFLESEGGQFHLVAMPGGRTRLEGTTWYRHSLWPAVYWRLWSDELIHRIHMRMLRHIKRESEGRLTAAHSTAR